jgi:tetratricopeptide (TPR) repeat protein
MQTTKGKSLLRKVLLFSCCCIVSLGALTASGLHLNQAEGLYRRTDYQGSLSVLSSEKDDASANFLIARNYFMLADYKKATDYLQKAIAAAPANGEYKDWLGKTYGKRAETANPLLAPGLAVKARQSFERSIELDPRNSEALEDLFDYYLEAPSFLGGGYDKASDVAGKIAAIDPSEGHFVKAKLAQKRKEYADAESHFREAVGADPHAVGHQIGLAKFLANQGRTRESDEVLEAAQKEQPNSPKLWFARADILIRQNRDLAEAKLLLQRYLEAPVTVDDPPKEQALKLLKQAGA